MIPHPTALLSPLDGDAVERLLDSAYRILDEHGFALEECAARRLMIAHGARVDETSHRVRLSPSQTAAWLAHAPASFQVAARNPRRGVTVGDGSMLVSPGYGSAFVASTDGRRRPSTLADLRGFAALAGRCDMLDITGGLLVEPCDVPEAARPLEATMALVHASDKPFFGSVAGRAGAEESLRIAEILFGASIDHPVMLALVNINSPLRLDARMAEALMAYASAGQPVILTPGIMMGITAPVTVAGAMAQAFAELMGAACLAQMVRPGTPVIFGIGGFGADLAVAGSGFGRPENALGAVLGAQLARRLSLPFRCSAMVTGARRPDARCGFEKMMTAMAAWMGGSHLAMQAVGILDCINSMSYEQFWIDIEAWRYISRLARPVATDGAHLALDEIMAATGDYLSSAHTVEHMRRELHPATLATPDSYDAWLASGASDTAAVAARQLPENLSEGASFPLPENVARDLDRYAAERRRHIFGAAVQF